MNTNTTVVKGKWVNRPYGGVKKAAVKVWIPKEASHARLLANLEAVSVMVRALVKRPVH